MRIVKDTYFKSLPDEESNMSGFPLPNSSEKIKFESCEFHPRLWEFLQQDPGALRNWSYENCNWPRWLPH